MKKVLVTGGAGFLGSHLCRKLWEKGNYVIAIDNFFTGNKRNLRELVNLKLDTFYLFYQDINQPFHFEVDEIYHLACPASPVYYQKNPVRTIETCVKGTFNVLDLCRNVGAKSLIASTSEIYGDPLIHPQVESYLGNVNTLGPRSNYDEGKRCAEALSYSFAKQYDMDIKIVRIFNTYGPNMALNDGRVVTNFITQALKNDPITVYGDGRQTRSFCYVDDMIDAFIKVMENGKSVDPINLGNPVETTMVELAETIISLTNSKSEIIFNDLPKDDPTRRKPDITKAKQLLNWEPKTNLIDGLNKTISHIIPRM